MYTAKGWGRDLWFDTQMPFHANTLSHYNVQYKTSEGKNYNDLLQILKSYTSKSILLHGWNAKESFTSQKCGYTSAKQIVI